MVAILAQDCSLVIQPFLDFWYFHFFSIRCYFNGYYHLSTILFPLFHFIRFVRQLRPGSSFSKYIRATRSDEKNVLRHVGSSEKMENTTERLRKKKHSLVAQSIRQLRPCSF